MDAQAAAACLEALQSEGAWALSGPLLAACLEAGAVVSPVLLQHILLVATQDKSWRVAKEVLQVCSKSKAHPRNSNSIVCWHVKTCARVHEVTCIAGFGIHIDKRIGRLAKLSLASDHGVPSNATHRHYCATALPTGDKCVQPAGRSRSAAAADPHSTPSSDIKRQQPRATPAAAAWSVG